MTEVMNPADLPSRGCTVQQLLQAIWWEGPAWLKLPAEDRPSGEPQTDEEILEQKRRKCIVSSLLCKGDRLTGNMPFPAIMTRL